jgi:hypothetical protein
MSTTISKKVEFRDYTYDNAFNCICHYEYQSTADCFSFHVEYPEDSSGKIIKYNFNFTMSTEVAHLLKEAIEAASLGKMGKPKNTGNRFLGEV